MNSLASVTQLKEYFGFGTSKITELINGVRDGIKSGRYPAYAVIGEPKGRGVRVMTTAVIDYAATHGESDMPFDSAQIARDYGIIGAENLGGLQSEKNIRVV